MSEPATITVDGNEAVASVAHRTNELIAIYPITPASPIGELCDEWSVQKRTNLWGMVPEVIEMQSEAGAAGTVHGSLQAGALTTTFTASQGLLLMVPNMYKIAGELNSYCMHVASRTVATHALSIFGDHSDVMACRATGFAMLCSCSVQEAHDFACIGQAATLKSRIPLMHFFDGFRTSHEIAKIRRLGDDDLRFMIDDDLVAAHRHRALTPDKPVIRGTAQNPDTFFQAREACNPFYDTCPQIVQDVMERFAQRTGRAYRLFDYVGDSQAERIIVMMGSGCETAHDTVEHLIQKGERVGLIKVRLFRPFSVERFIGVIPPTARSIAVLDRTKEPGSVGEPLYQDVVTALREAQDTGLSNFTSEPRVVGGRYGLSSKEFTPAMVKAVFDGLAADHPKNHFTVGIVDDVTHHSIQYEPDFDIEPADGIRAVFFGLGSDGTVGANKNSIKIIGDETDLHVQGYFVYDSKKSGARTISYLRASDHPIHSAYLTRRATFVACHQFSFLDRYDVLNDAAPEAVFLLNASYGPDDVWDHLPRQVQQQIIDKRLRFYVIDAYKIARQNQLGGRINTVMQACFFALTKVIDLDHALAKIKDNIRKTYERKGDEVVTRNLSAIDQALSNLHQVKVPATATTQHTRAPIVPGTAPDFIQRVTDAILAGKGDLLPVSAFPPDGTWPTGTSRWERRNIATEIPIWEPQTCIQCNQCVLVCPHAAIRAQVYDDKHLQDAPQGFKSTDYIAPDFRGLKYTLQVAPEDCTGCHMCVMVCPAKDKSSPKHKAINMAPHGAHLQQERTNYDFFLSLPPIDRTKVERLDAKGSQFFEPLFEYSGACAGCGETPYIKLLTQLFGDRTLIANATGCSSIYGGNLPTTPYCTNHEGRGPAWSNSLFEDNAEFGFGFRLALDRHTEHATTLLKRLAPHIGQTLVDELLSADQHTDVDVIAQRRRVEALRQHLNDVNDEDARLLNDLADSLVRKSVWLVGGDGWAYDIGFGGLDHVLASKHDVNILVLDTEVYSNTGGQQSKATPLGASAKFAIAGKEVHKKDLGLMAMSYGHVYVASIAFGADQNQTVKAFLEAESYPGPSLIIAYSHCVAHGYDLRYGVDQQRRAVSCGIWPMYRFDPRRISADQPPLHLDTGPLKGSIREYMANEARFRMVEMIDPQRFQRLAQAATRQNSQRIELYQQLAQLHLSANGDHKSKERPSSTPATIA